MIMKAKEVIFTILSLPFFGATLYLICSAIYRILTGDFENGIFFILCACVFLMGSMEIRYGLEDGIPGVRPRGRRR